MTTHPHDPADRPADVRGTVVVDGIPRRAVYRGGYQADDLVYLDLSGAWQRPTTKIAITFRTDPPPAPPVVRDYVPHPATVIETLIAIALLPFVDNKPQPLYLLGKLLGAQLREADERARFLAAARVALSPVAGSSPGDAYGALMAGWNDGSPDRRPGSPL